MRKSSPVDILNQTIASLTLKRDEDLESLKEQFHTTYESLKLVNIIKGAFHEVADSPDLKNNISSAAIGIASGYLAKNVLFRTSKNPLKVLAGILFQTIITNVAAKHSDTIKTSGLKLLDIIIAAVSRDKSQNTED